MNNSSPEANSCLGIHLDGFGVSGVLASGVSTAVSLDFGSLPAPPAAILGCLHAEQTRADVLGLPSVRGCGRDWPTEACVSQGAGSARYPLAYAWAMSLHTPTSAWTWVVPEEGRSASKCDAAEAISRVFHETVRSFHLDRVANDPVLVIPDRMDIRTQQAILDAPFLRELHPRFLWRPIAAGLVWIDSFQGELKSRRPNKDDSLGKLLSIHLGGDGFEATVVEIVAREEDNWQPLAARRRPSLPSMPEGAIWLAERTSSNWSHDGVGDNECWSRTWLQFEFESNSLDLGGESADSPLKAIREASGARWPERTPQQWLHELIPMLHAEQGQLIGIVLTGRFANASLDGQPIRHWLERSIGLPSNTLTLVEGENDAPEHVLATGAALFEARRSAGHPTYLDTLPTLRTLVKRRGVPAWVSLLSDDDHFVCGGQPFECKSSNDYTIGAEEEYLTLFIDMEGHETVRTVRTLLPSPTEQNEQVSLKVSITPARGNAIVEVLPDNEAVFHGRHIYIDWLNAKDEEMTPQECAVKLGYDFPLIEPRRASGFRWFGGQARDDVEGDWRGIRNDVLSHVEQISGQAPTDCCFAELRKDLREKDDYLKRNQESLHWTCVDSDGRLDADDSEQAILERLINWIVMHLRIQNGELSCGGDDALRILGYCSARNPDLERLMPKRLKLDGELSAAELVLFGNCLRAPDDIALFLRTMAHWMRQTTRPNDWMRALARILQYREDACMKADSECCYELLKSCLPHFDDQLKKRNLQMKARHSCLCIAYLLRRRADDPGFLDPESGMAEEIKASFNLARKGGLKAMGGFVDIPGVMQCLIDYIDLRGKEIIRLSRD